jgi:membrane associated rhomboid family serine protease
MAISLLVVFLYGSMIWGVLPIQPYISWESHLLGAIAGIILAIYYKDKGPARRIYTWEIEEDEEINDEEKYWEIDAESNKGDNEK